ncbi:MAG: hypothetical protein O7C98_13745, partial [Planctomycetota bacterium]|nr:hypothetical protein [Planctomycetota bacterium]
FLQAATYARARLTLGTVDDFRKAVLHLNVPLRELGKRGAPRVEQGRFMSESALVWRDAFPGMREMIDQMISSASGRPKADLYRRIGGESARQWIRLAAASRERDSVVQLNRKPVGARATMRRIVAESAWLPPGLICDARIELGWTLHLCGDRNGARKELQQAVASAPDTVRRRRAKRYLEQLNSKPKKEQERKGAFEHDPEAGSGFGALPWVIGTLGAMFLLLKRKGAKGEPSTRTRGVDG